ncbi:hypothetical protein EV421DRAFT_1909609 [Armillaria borealis]|uniref:Uncharacterized protein n=1 Tax=Armillaria borealis TaxID=47425 RepID=A0AA39J115_9AGAR|nr:hypothetical protein EV421DRAFT_1909609 [Armillaria borealis]
MPKAGSRSTQNSNKKGILGESAAPKTGPQRSKRNTKGSQQEMASLVIKSSDKSIVDFTKGENGEGSNTANKPSHPGGSSRKQVQSCESSVLSADETTDPEVTSVQKGELLKLQMGILLREHLLLKKRHKELKGRLGNNDRESHPGPLTLKVDRFSNVEIHNMVESLNNDIVALCSAIAYELSRDLIPIALHPLVVDTVPAVVHITGALGRNFANLLLYKTDMGHGRLIVLLALQSILSKTCTDLIQFWSMNEEEQVVLQSLYSQFLIQSPDVAGHWRAMMRVRSKHAEPNSDLMTTTCECRLIDDIVKVLTAAGWREFNAEETINNKYGQHVKDVVELIIKLDKAMGEDVVSQDLHVYTAPPDIPFAPAHMADQNKGPSEGSSADDLVAVCTSIGLLAKCREPEDRGNVVGGVGPKEQILLKPIVILRSALEYIN